MLDWILDVSHLSSFSYRIKSTWWFDPERDRSSPDAFRITGDTQSGGLQLRFRMPAWWTGLPEPPARWWRWRRERSWRWWRRRRRKGVQLDKWWRHARYAASIIHRPFHLIELRQLLFHSSLVHHIDCSYELAFTRSFAYVTWFAYGWITAEWGELSWQVCWHVCIRYNARLLNTLRSRQRWECNGKPKVEKKKEKKKEREREREIDPRRSTSMTPWRFRWPFTRSSAANHRRRNSGSADNCVYRTCNVTTIIALRTGKQIRMLMKRPLWERGRT